MSSQSFAAFNTLMESVDQLIEIHGKLQTGRGRRHEQDALHRAGVVMTVAAWQAYVEKVLVEALDFIALGFNDPAVAVPQWARSAYVIRRADVLKDVKKFNTPSDVNVRDLFVGSLGFNPWPAWEWHKGRRQWTIVEVRNRTNTWVMSRHSVAHAFPLPDNIPWLKDANGTPRLTLTLLKECRAHFRFLVGQTDAALSVHLTNEHGIETPW